jgi:ubiquinone/menaquinone biosynthesis C-methylase UbiE
MTAQEWDARYAEGRQWSTGPNELFAQVIADLPPGRFLDVAGGEGRNAIWLASRGWDCTVLDFSLVALERAREQAEQQGLSVGVALGDATAIDPGLGRFDLVAVLYLHLPAEQQALALAGAARALEPGGTLVVLGHHPRNLGHGVGGPQDPAILHDEDALAGWVDDLLVVRRETVVRTTPQGDALDALLVAERPPA